MTVSTTTRKTQTPGNGSQVVFQFLFKVSSASELYVAIANTSPTGPVGLLELTGGGVDYSATIDANGTGEITLLNNYAVAGTPGPPTSLQTLTCYRMTSTDQTTDFEAFDDFRSGDHENALDKMAKTVQELVEDVARCPKVHIASMIPPGDVVITNYTLLEETNERAHVLIDEASVSAGAVVDVWGVLSNYDVVDCEIVVINIDSPATSQDIRFRLLDDAGDPVVGSNYEYAGTIQDCNGGSSVLSGDGVDHVVLATDVLDHASFGVTGRLSMRIHNMVWARVWGHMTWRDISNYTTNEQLSIGYPALINSPGGFRFYHADSTLTALVRLWGMAKGS